MTADALAQRRIYLDVATEAALEAGTVLLQHWGDLAEVSEKGRVGDLVTSADRASERTILQVLQRHVPDHAIQAEESSPEGNPDSACQWAIDPLDGTTNFAHQYPLCAVSIALLVEGTPQVGVVYNPIFGELFRAARGWGVTRNRHPIAPSRTSTLADSLLVSGFAYDFRHTADNNCAEFCHLLHLTRGVRRSGAASLDLASVACGRFDGYWERGLSPWDMAAGIVLVEEAGGRTSAYDGSPLQLELGRILASNGVLHGELSSALLAAPR
jgi:myo-inositol-1(or 4)-monophosphatase